MKVYLIRHAQSEGNVLDYRARATVGEFNDLLSRSHAHPLTPEGERQAIRVAERFATHTIDRLYSSPFPRALTTARIVGAPLGLQPQVVDELREVVPNALAPHIRRASLRRLYLRSFAVMLRPREGSVGWRDEMRRARAAWETITAEPANEVIAVSHGWLISLMLLSLRRDRRWRILNRDVSNAGVSVVQLQESR